MKKKRIDQLTFLRFIAAILVVITHYGGAYYPFTVEPWRHIPADGPFILGFFFVLSGFIMTYVYYPQEGRRINWKEFVIKRISRFYPLYFVAILAMIPFRYGDDAHNLTGLFLDLFLLQSWVPEYALAFNGPAWAMSVFFAFYLIFPLVVAWLVKKGSEFSTRFTIFVWLLSQGVFYFLLNVLYDGGAFWNGFLLYNPILHFNTFLVGIWGGLYYREKGRDRKINPAVNLVLLLLLAVGFILILFYRGKAASLLGGRVTFNNGILAPFYLAVILVLANDIGWAAQLLQKPLFVRLGEISFSIYLLQSPMVQVYQTYLLERLERVFPGTAAFHFYLYLGILIPAAFLLFHLYEKPAQGWIRKLLLAG